ncbi:MAG: hypothetical protein ACFFDI_29995, partial [Promethearchaeota archaeon]
SPSAEIPTIPPMAQYTYIFFPRIENKILELKNGGFQLYLPAKYKMAYAEHIGTINPKKRTDFFAFLTSAISYITFQGINTKAITPNGFFDFSLLPSIQIHGLENYLVNYRRGRSYTSIRKQFALSQGIFSKYEKGLHTIPLGLFQQIVKNQKNNSKTLMEILYDHREKIYFRSASSPPMKLPLRVSPQIIQLMGHLIPRINYAAIIDADEEIIDQLKAIFQTDIVNRRIMGRLIVSFLETFGHYHKRKLSVSSTKTAILKTKWLQDLDLMDP